MEHKNIKRTNLFIDYIRKSRVNKAVRAIRKFLRKLPFYGKGVFCPVCEKSSRKFADQYSGEMCIHCESLERHRLVWLYLKKKTDLFDGIPKRVLHVAPEECLIGGLKERFQNDEYITADMEDPTAMVRMDITDIQYPDGYFDVIMCSHVLEHVQNDLLAMNELNRVLNREGWAILMVPIHAEKTFEIPAEVGPDERLKLYGQEGHVRVYGLDYYDRLLSAGFHVKAIKASDLFAADDILRMRLVASGDKYIYHCTKK